MYYILNIFINNDLIIIITLINIWSTIIILIISKYIFNWI